MPGRSWRTRQIALVAMLIAATVSGCGLLRGSGEAPDAPPPQKIERDRVRSEAASLLLTNEDLGGGWAKEDPAPDTFGWTLCGVDNEPEPPAASASAEWNGLGPPIGQTVRPVGKKQATTVVRQMQKALGTCHTDTMPGDKSPMEVVRVPMKNSDAVAFSLHHPGTDVWMYWVYFSYKESLIAFRTMYNSADFPPDTLDSMVEVQGTK